MMKQTTCYGCDKPIEPEWLPEGEFIVCDECSSTTDRLSVEKLQEQLSTAKKALTESKELLRDMNRECDGLSEPEETLYNIISQALTAIGGDGCPAGAVGKNGLTKDEIEGSGDGQ
ncbi:hypothetical protein [Lactococcus lactis]|uniref:hypothetical protein n=1 Tax=Lactococcus lactis TaxID=1358 RepID=UPI00223AAB10|nr:hypothetical protein [Lactococcus lactis]MCT0068045.1 hypothetical protein [Lactococcus lactis subsp. lactis]